MAELTTYDFTVHMNGHVRIDAQSKEEAIAEFDREFAHEPVLVAPTQDQIFVVSAIAWEEPTLYVEEGDDAD